jgi:uncharacterized membrane protein YqjE
MLPLLQTPLFQKRAKSYRSKTQSHMTRLMFGIAWFVSLLLLLNFSARFLIQKISNEYFWKDDVETTVVLFLVACLIACVVSIWGTINGFLPGTRSSRRDR